MGLRTDDSIFLITAIDHIPTGLEKDRSSFGKVCGWYSSEQAAVEAVSDNHHDIHAGRYQYAIIQELPQGIASRPLNVMWFSWNETGEYYDVVLDPMTLVTPAQKEKVEAMRETR